MTWVTRTTRSSTVCVPLSRPNPDIDHGLPELSVTSFEELTPGIAMSAERCADAQARRQGDLRDQQAAAEQADLVVFALQVGLYVQ